MNNHKPQENSHQSKAISEKSFTEQLTALPHEMTPERDLWAGIERAINGKSQEKSDNKENNVFIPSAWAASIAMVILMSWFTFSPSENGKNIPVQVKTQKADPSQGQLVNFMQQNFKQQKQTLLASYGQPNVEKLPTAMQIELKQLADARTSIRKALLTDENNADLLNLLDFTQQQELKLLQQLYRQYQVI